ncbi:formyltransferase family protein [Pseudobutyrivibrio ruminis]|uniref:Methionyl-tRNA formyltransferase n=1 Tax=Pseudobutyrivibrio ruminis TaxID=46206 RepID=A0A2G3DU76_9FIRM|nr:formyltransferase family protein [Pseudobutyrivibrio ruminis]PHU34440.1 methionyl-tRNA formyltransferase [Pseudobutyrivibrio ruminis]
MKITVFTSNQPRHLSLIRRLSEVADVVYAIEEGTTVFPGEVKDRYDNSPVMKEYFERVRQAEEKVFGKVGFLPRNVRQLCLKAGDLKYMSIADLDEALHSDVYLVFGAGFIKGDLIHFLEKNKAINIHMGVSPYFRGASCNFWAAYDGYPEFVGATIHMLSEELDAGDMLYHALPKPQNVDLFELGMIAVRVAHDSVVERIRDGSLFLIQGQKQDSAAEIRYSRNKEFDDVVAKDYLSNRMTSEEVEKKLCQRDLSLLKDPYIG